jgi:signal transduction histidine kinase
VPLAPIVRRMQTAARARGRDFELDLQADVATRGHTERLERVIGHLIDNAFDATEPSGRVSVCVSRSGSQAELVVSDTGKGMSTEFIQTRLFKPFQSTKQQGMGIGAYESFEYIKELGGDLKVESIEGQGTTIKVSLPLLDLRRDSDLGLKAS